jgi:MYXO-CTERM domain-containing protein
VTTLLFSLLTLVPADAALVALPPTQPACPWNQEALTLLWPKDDAIIASNASLWFRVNDGPAPVGLTTPRLEDESRGRVELEEKRTPIPTGSLLELRPVQQLTPGNRYTLFYANQTVPLTASGPIFGAPERVEIERIIPITEAPNNTACDTTGIVVEPRFDNAELHMFVGDNGEVHGVSSDPTIIVVGTPGQSICGRVIAMDSVGRQSEPSDNNCQTAGAPKIDYNGGSLGRERGPFSAFGCSTTEGASGDAAILLALAGLLALVARRRS